MVIALEELVIRVLCLSTGVIRNGYCSQLSYLERLKLNYLQNNSENYSHKLNDIRFCVKNILSIFNLLAEDNFTLLTI